ncbi:MAG: hypothetical protein WBA74_02470 [Cyclobacteriaceae bacterium]
MIDEIETLIHEQNQDIRKFNLIMIIVLSFGIVLAILLPIFNLGIQSDLIKSGLGLMISSLGFLAQLPNSRKRSSITKLNLIKQRWINGDREKKKIIEDKMLELLIKI